MVDRYTALTVVLEEPTRSDDTENLIRAIRTLRGVLDVVPVVNSSDAYSAELRCHARIEREVLDVLKRVRP